MNGSCSIFGMTSLKMKKQSAGVPFSDRFDRLSVGQQLQTTVFGVRVTKFSQL
jgi:hypothetical protein